MNQIFPTSSKCLINVNPIVYFNKMLTQFDFTAIDELNPILQKGFNQLFEKEVLFSVK
jgi:hypothetical protein